MFGGGIFAVQKRQLFSKRDIIWKPHFLSGQTPDDDGNYAFQFATDDGQYRQETGRQVATADGDATEITGSNHIFLLNIVARALKDFPTTSEKKI